MISKTNIFVALNSTKTRQMVIYSYPNDEQTMILPVPYPDTFQFHEMNKIPDFFERVSNSFVSIASLGRKKKVKPRIKVSEMGGYLVSIVPRLVDLSRVNKIFFSISEELKERLREKYSQCYWGFIVFALEKGYKQHKPFAYSHAVLNHQLLIPSRHCSNKIDNRSIFRKISDALRFKKDDYCEWSHAIYLYNCGKSGNNCVELNTANGQWDHTFIRRIFFDRLLIDFRLMYCDTFQKYTIYGRHPPIDFFIAYV